MEITHEEAELMLKKRLEEYPEVKALVSDPQFKSTLSDILEFESVNQSFLPIIESYLMTVLTFYAPIGDLSRKISESTGLSLELCENLVGMIESILLEPIREALYAFEYHVENELNKIGSIPDANSELKERLELKPQEVTPQAGEIENAGTRPLTREELMSALAPRRTMASDIEAVRIKADGGGNPQT